MTDNFSKRTIAVMVDNEPGVLARIAGLFSARGFNIDSLTVAETEPDAHQSRITIVTSGDTGTIEQIEKQLHRIISVASVTDITNTPDGLVRELALIKVKGTGTKRVEALRLAEIFRARVIDTTTESFVFELTGSSDKLGKFIDLMTPLGLVEVARSGSLSIERGKQKSDTKRGRKKV